MKDQITAIIIVAQRNINVQYCCVYSATNKETKTTKKKADEKQPIWYSQ